MKNIERESRLYFTMNARRTSRQRAKHLELLKKQQAHLLQLAEFHWRWMKDADDIETRRIYRGIANLIRKSADRYADVMDALQKQLDKE